VNLSELKICLTLNLTTSLVNDIRYAVPVSMVNSDDYSYNVKHEFIVLF